MYMIAGKRIIIRNEITKKVPCRKHRKRRINKKWLKRYGTRLVPDNHSMYVTKDYIFMTQKCFDKLSPLIEHYDEVTYGKIYG